MIFLIPGADITLPEGRTPDRLHNHLDITNPWPSQRKSMREPRDVR